MAFPLVKLSGSPYEQGLEHGQSLKTQIAHNLDVYFERFKTEVYLERDEVITRANRYADAIKIQSPDYYASMRGVAEGSGFNVEDIAALNVRYEILYYEFAASETARKEAGIDGCTSFAVAPERMNNGHLVIGQTWDWIPQVKGALLHTEHDGVISLAFSEAGIVGGKIGMNNAGLGLCINGLASLVDDWTTLQKPFHVRCYDILKQTSFEAAKNIVLAEDRPGSANYLIAQIPDRAVNIESAPKTVNLIDFAGGSISHTNHFNNPKNMGLAEIENEFWEYSCGRQARMKEMLHSKEALTLGDIQGFLKDHHGHPNSVCRHEDLDFGLEEHCISVTAVVMDLTEKIMWISDGPACENPFEEHHF